ncbi:hypothetical protein DSCA_00300 [Desulfosarcina alkanivorans]|uniref:Uncharacterized protein n=1 Tax=Desulfosarcina alkanivorans TaxID=571177 RepID=A0A5K7YDP9_9BACT|nr:hypothetical protein [Desulfosarcina alkanivorans]BBO66100.1 hypothetical protein DSCA_00300 [Desulfosarcina alkanivorans]
MVELQKFRLYGENDPQVEEKLQPNLELRGWLDLDKTEKANALQYMINTGWIEKYSKEILGTISYLNEHYLRICPGKNLHKIPPERGNRRGSGNEYKRIDAAIIDFKQILLSENSSEELVYLMLSKFAENYIDEYHYRITEKAEIEEERDSNIREAFRQFDRLSNCLNHIFDQFSLNVIITRIGLIPRQDIKITKNIYTPVLNILSDPKWKSLNGDLSIMFSNYREQNYPEVITMAHRSVQRFLQILVGEEGKSGKGEMKKLFATVKTQELIPINRFTEPLIKFFQGFIVSERATKSTAKPTEIIATSSDALLIMNLVMVFFATLFSSNQLINKSHTNQFKKSDATRPRHRPGRCEFIFYQPWSVQWYDHFPCHPGF